MRHAEPRVRDLLTPRRVLTAATVAGSITVGALLGWWVLLAVLTLQAAAWLVHGIRQDRDYDHSQQWWPWDDEDPLNG